MIPSSKVAFQVLSMIISVISVIACGMTAYLLAFHIYLSKSIVKVRCTYIYLYLLLFFLLQVYHHKSTYDFVISRRLDRTVDQTLLQFNQLSRGKQNDSTDSARQSSSLTKFFPFKVNFLLYFISLKIYRFIFL